MIITPRVTPIVTINNHPGTFLRRTWSGWYLQPRPRKQPQTPSRGAVPVCGGPFSPATERYWFGLYSRSFGRRVMSDGRLPDNGKPISLALWDAGNAAWNARGGYLGHTWLSGQNFYQHLNMVGVETCTRNWAAPPPFGVDIVAARANAPGFSQIQLSGPITVVIGQYVALTFPGNVHLHSAVAGFRALMRLQETLIAGTQVYEDGTAAGINPGGPITVTP